MPEAPRPPRMPVLWRYLLAAACGPTGAWIAAHSGLALRSGNCSAGALIILLAVAPAVEETVFRAGLHGWLTVRLQPHKIGGLSAPNLVVAVAFGTLHALHQSSWLMFFTAIPALLMGWVWELSGGRLIAPVLLHAWFNLCIAAASCEWVAP